MSEKEVMSDNHPKETEKEDDMGIIRDDKKLQEDIPNSMVQSRDQEMTPSEVGNEDQ